MRILLIAVILLSVLSRLPAQPPLDFTLFDQDSVSWNLYDELGKGNTVLLDFFFAACVPCQTYTPEIEQIYQDYGSGTGNLIVLGISDRDDNDALFVFDTTYGVTYPSGGTKGNGPEITLLYRDWFSFSSWPKYAIVCTDTSIFWGVTPSIGMAALRNKIDTCDILTNVDARKLHKPVVNIYPNPVHGYLELDLTGNENAGVSISLYNLHGVVIKKTRRRISGRFRWELDDVRAGYYLIEISQNGSVISRGKLLILR